VDVIGANSLGVANAWDRVRIGGGLGGDKPEETLRKGSIASTPTRQLHDDAGGVPAHGGYGSPPPSRPARRVHPLRAAGVPLGGAERSPHQGGGRVRRAGGYYERVAFDLLRERRFGFTKPIVCCVHGRWRNEVTRTCGHAGALAATARRRVEGAWFDEYFEVPVFDRKRAR